MAISHRTLTSKMIFDRVYIEFGKNIGSHVSERIFRHLESVETIKKISYTILNNSSSSVVYKETSGAVYLTFGNSSESLKMITESELLKLDYESFRITSQQTSTGLIKIATNGLPLHPYPHTNLSFNKEDIHYGAVLGSYALLELLGFAFLHPLDPYTPPFISLTEICIDNNKQTINNSFPDIKREYCSFNVNITESPYWPERSFHLHTQHPLELTEVLQVLYLNDVTRFTFLDI